MRYYRALQICFEDAGSLPTKTFDGAVYAKVGAFVVPAPYVGYEEVDDTPDLTLVIKAEDPDLDGIQELSVYALLSFVSQPDMRATLMAENTAGDSLHLTLVTYSKFECRDLAYKNIFAIDLPINLKTEPTLVNEHAIVQGVVDMVCMSEGERWMRPSYGMNTIRSLIFRTIGNTSDTDAVLDEVEAKVVEHFTDVYLLKERSTIDIDPDGHKIGLHLVIFLGGLIRKRVIIREVLTL